MLRPRSLVRAPQRALRVFSFAAFVLITAASLFAGDLRLPLPKKSKYTPVQALNRDGVKAVEHHQYDKAKKLFYKAYLIDPNDPFTLNNLGYMAELDGDSDRARRYYALSAEMGSDAIIDKANNEVMEGKPVSAVAGQAEDKGIKINRLNNEAIALLEKDRAPEADLILQKALTVDSSNPFTLNNLGYAKEKEGEIEAAYQFYTAAANRNSQEKVEVAIDKDWRGRAISDVAHDNARKLNKRMRNGNNDMEAQVALLNLRGVSALNRNDRRTGREFIQKAFKLDPADAFTLNNMGYLAEMDGDKETADFYYERAREANQKNAKIAVATRKEVEGKKIGDVADTTDQLVESQMEAAREARQRQGGPVLLMHRDNTAVVEPPKPLHEIPHERVSNENGELMLPAPKATSSEPLPVYKEPGANQPGGLMQPLPDNEQPSTVKEGPNNKGLLMPLPDDEQPGSQPNSSEPAAQPKEGQHNGGMIMPLPDDEQPGAQPNNTQPAQEPKEGQHQGGMIMPLPDDQQPGAVGAQPSAQPATPQPTEGKHDGGMIMPLPDNQQPSATKPPAAPAQQSSPQSAQPVQPVVPQPSRPAQTAPQTPAQTSQPGLLLPPPDNQQQPQTAQPNSVNSPTAPQSNTGVYTPPATTSNPPAHISDTDTNAKKPDQKKSTQPAGPAPKKITDQP